MAEGRKEEKGRAGRRARKRAQVRQRLLEEGLRLMGEMGVQACKVEHVTKAAQVGKGTFFTHFASKESFVAELVDMVLADLGRRVRPLGLSRTDAGALLSGVGAVHLRYFQLRPAAAALLMQACSLDSGQWAGASVASSLEDYLSMVAEMAAPAAEHLGWPPGRGRELALMLLSAACGFFWMGKPLGLGRDAPSALLDRLGRAMARGLASGA